MQWRQSPNLMLILAGLIQRGFGFLTTLVLARLAGIESVGLYTGLQISASTITTPVSVPLANSATLVTARHLEQGLKPLLAAHSGALGLTALSVVMACVALTHFSDLSDKARSVWPWWAPFLCVSLLALSQLLSQVMAGLFHGAGRGLPVARLTLISTCAGIVLCWPVVQLAGVPGLLGLSIAVVTLPALIMMRQAWRDAPHTTNPLVQNLKASVWQSARDALPSVASTLIRNGASWFCCIYLAQRLHGAAGVGIVSIGLQWMMLMQFPVSALGGRMVADLGQASSVGDQALRQSTQHWLKRCLWTTALISAGVAAASPLITWLYKQSAGPLLWILLINAAVSVIISTTYVQERAFFCREWQKRWLVLSLLGDLAQVAFTLTLAHHSILIIAAGGLVSSTLVMVGGFWMLSRPFNSSSKPS
jgi:O-antigen/teichoic acid export membrane protein